MIKFPALLLSLVLSGSCAAENWPCFRGPSRQGVTASTALPVKWSATENVRWKVAIPGAAWSSPIVWGDRIFLTAADDGGQSCRILCVDAASGRILWNREIFRQPALRKESRNSYATPTPLTDGKHVYAVFGGGGFAAVDFKGTVVWTNQENEFYSRHGMGSSPLLEDGLIVMPWDWSTNPDKEGADKERVGWQLPWDRSFVLALHANSGKQAWKTGRGTSRIAHITPQVWTDGTGRKQVISPAGDVVQGFDLKTGERLWTASNPGEGVSPSAVIVDDIVIQPNGFAGAESVRAFRMTGAKGDTGESTMVWEQDKNAPKMSSMIYAAPHLFAVAEGGLAWCADAKTGEVVWRERLTGSTFSSSPILSGGKIYITGDEGITYVFKAGAKFELIAQNPLEEKVQASPAVWGDRLIIRTEKTLYCIGQ
jgi:outer membrane protein assembly factor BamB